MLMFCGPVCVGESFIPYYTGKAIDGIVVHKSMEYFTKPLLTVAALALARYHITLPLWVVTESLNCLQSICYLVK